MKKIKIFKILLILLFLVSSSFSEELKKITIQLSWFNQFQFAGYYVAKEKGFYKEMGFDVEIIPFNFDSNIPKLVNDSEIDFAVGRETLILDKGKNKNIIALYALFQATPLVLLSTKESGISKVKDFKDKKIMTTIDDASEASLKAMITSSKIELSDLTFLNHTHNINDLINKKTDIISAYLSKSPFELKKRNVAFNVFDPKEYGFDLYSDFLFTSKALIRKDSKLVESFKEASLKGWEYAYSNIEESVDIILNKYNTQNLTKDELIYEANELKKLSYYKKAKIGEINKQKVQRIHDLYNILGLLEKPINIEEFIYEDYFKSIGKLNFLPHYKKYIEENKIVNMCIIPDIKPYSFIENEKFSGFVSDYFKVIEEKIGLSFNIIKTDSLIQSLEYLKSKKCDILASAEDIKERNNYANFTKPYLRVPFVLITKSNTTFIEDISVLKGKKIGIVGDYSANRHIRQAYPKIDFINVKSIDSGIEKVLNEELYGHIDLLYTSWYKIYSNTLNALKISARLDLTVPISIAIRKDNRLLYQVLDFAVENIDKNTRDEILRKWVTVEYQKETDYSILWKIFFGVFIVLLAILYKQKVLKDVNDDLKEKVDEKNKELIDINFKLEERIKLEVEENLKKDRLLGQQSKMIAMGQMIENIAHQWRQPLSLITTLASGIKLKKEVNDLEEKFLKDSIDSIINTSTYLSNTIDDFRYFFEPQKEKTLFSLIQCCQKTVSLINPSFNTKNIKIEIISSEDIKINGFERELIQVLINILNNSKDALKDSKENEKIILIELFKSRNNNVVIEIKDNANGIKEDILDKIYEPYFTTKHRSQGTGIGLYMCQEIVAKHMNGKINTKNVEFKYNNKKYKGALTSIVLDI